MLRQTALVSPSLARKVLPVEFWVTQIPRLREDRIAVLPPDPSRVVSYVKRGGYDNYRGPDFVYVVSWGNSPFDPKERPGRWYVSLSIPDTKIEKVWESLEVWAERLKEMGVAGLVGVPITVYVDDPLPVQLFNLWRVRFIERYLQDMGFEVVPTLDATHHILHLYAATVPQGSPSVFMCRQLSFRKMKSAFVLNDKGLLYKALSLLPNVRQVVIAGPEGGRGLVEAGRVSSGRTFYILNWGREYRKYLAIRAARRERFKGRMRWSR